MPYGALDLFVLKTLDAMGPLHGFGLARRIEQTSGRRLQINQGSIYPALLRLGQSGWIRYEWGTSEKNRRAKYYALTESGRRQLRKQVKSWERTAAIVALFLEEAPSSSGDGWRA